MDEDDPLLDALVIAEIRSGNRRAYGILIDRYQVRLRAELAAYLLDEDERESVLREVFAEAFPLLAQHDRRSSFHPWLRTLALDALRRKVGSGQPGASQGGDPLREVVLAQVIDAEAVTRVETRWQDAARGLQALPAEDVALLADRYQSTHSLAELAARHRTSTTGLALRLLQVRGRCAFTSGSPVLAAPDDTDRLVAEVLDGDADGAARGRLADLVRNDPAVHARFLDQVTIAGALWAHYRPAHLLAGFRRDTLALLSGDDASVPDAGCRQESAPSAPHRSRRWWGLLAAMSLVVVAWLLASPGQPIVTRPDSTPTAVGGGGTGLRGDYFRDRHLTSLAATRIDAQVHFAWPGSPGDSVPADGFAVRWKGRVQPRTSGMHAFIIRADGGVRLWVDGRLLIDTWDRPDLADQRSGLVLEGGRLHDVQLDFHDDGGAAEISLWWEFPGQAREIVPAARLHPP